MTPAHDTVRPPDAPPRVRHAPAPAHLSDEAKREWRRLLREFELEDPAALLILQTGLEAFDRMRQAQAALRENGGPTFRDRWGRPKTHPAVAVERDSRTSCLAALKQLNLDLEPLRDAPGRPPGSPMDGGGGSRLLGD